jgi:hypothetical protein
MDLHYGPKFVTNFMSKESFQDPFACGLSTQTWFHNGNNFSINDCCSIRANFHFVISSSSSCSTLLKAISVTYVIVILRCMLGYTNDQQLYCKCPLVTLGIQVHLLLYGHEYV